MDIIYKSLSPMTEIASSERDPLSNIGFAFAILFIIPALVRTGVSLSPKGSAVVFFGLLAVIVFGGLNSWLTYAYPVWGRVYVILILIFALISSFVSSLAGK